MYQLASWPSRMAVGGETFSATRVLCMSNMQRMQVVRLCWRDPIASHNLGPLVEVAEVWRGCGLQRAVEGRKGVAGQPPSPGNRAGRFLKTILRGYSEPFERNPGFRML